MSEKDLNKKNNAICIYMGGIDVVLNLYYPEKTINTILISDLKFHNDWNFIMPVWKKLKADVSSREDQLAMYFAMNKALDEVDLEKLHNLVSVYCINWCKQKQIKL